MTDLYYIVLCSYIDEGVKLKTRPYYLVENMQRTCKFIVRKRWYHTLIGKPISALDECDAHSVNGARLIFKHRGFDFGLLD